MLCNLEELHSGLISLLQEVSNLHKDLVNPEIAKIENKRTFLVMLPKLILLTKLCPFLQINDIINLSTVCTVLRKSIYGPIGWKILNRTHSLYPIIARQIRTNVEKDSKEAQHFEMESYALTMIEDEKLLKKARLQCKKGLLQMFEKYRYKAEEHQELTNNLKAEKTQVIRLRMHRFYLEQRTSMLNEENSEYRAQLRTINEGFEERIKSLDSENDELLKEKNKLQTQKEALVCKIRQYQNEIENIRLDSQKSKQILKRIKNYLLYKEL